MGVLCCAGEQRRILILQIYKHVSGSLQVLKRVPQCLLVGQRSFPLEHDLITLHSRLGPKDADEIIARSPVVSNMSFSVSMSYSGSSASASSLSASGLGPKKTLSTIFHFCHRLYGLRWCPEGKHSSTGRLRHFPSHTTAA